MSLINKQINKRRIKNTNKIDTSYLHIDICLRLFNNNCKVYLSVYYHLLIRLMFYFLTCPSFCYLLSKAFVIGWFDWLYKTIECLLCTIKVKQKQTIDKHQIRLMFVCFCCFKGNGYCKQTRKNNWQTKVQIVKKIARKDKQKIA